MKLTKVNASSITPGPYRRDSLPADFVKQVESVVRALEGFAAVSVMKLCDGFRRDMNPDKELKVWKGIAKVCQDYSRMSPGTDKSQIYHVVLLTSLCYSPQEIAAGESIQLSLAEIEDIYALCTKVGTN